jgi:hypothetical protein
MGKAVYQVLPSGEAGAGSATRLGVAAALVLQTVELGVLGRDVGDS